MADAETWRNEERQGNEQLGDAHSRSKPIERSGPRILDSDPRTHPALRHNPTGILSREPRLGLPRPLLVVSNVALFRDRHMPSN